MSMLKALVLDDDDIICALLRELLTKQGFLVTTKTDPELGVALARSEQFDLVLLDVKMPKMNGIEALKRIRPLQQKAKFVMITASAEDELVGDAFTYGAILCLSKPIDARQVDELLTSIFALRVAARA
jgi:CheY-like chemotaxis protein